MVSPVTITIWPISVPGPPGEVSNEGKPQHNSVKISWSPPPNPNGTLTAFHVYCNGQIQNPYQKAFPNYHRKRISPF